MVFIVGSALALAVLTEFGLAEKYLGYALIPLLLSYYLGQYVERKTRM